MEYAFVKALFSSLTEMRYMYHVISHITMVTFYLKCQSGAYLINVHDTQKSEGEHANIRKILSQVVLFLFIRISLCI